MNYQCFTWHVPLIIWSHINNVDRYKMHRKYYLYIFQILYGEGNGNPLQYSCLENPMDRRSLVGCIHGVTKSRTWLSDFTFTFHFHTLEKEMATHFSVLAWRIPGTKEPGRLPSMGSHRVGHDWSDLAAAACPLREYAIQPFHSVSPTSPPALYLSQHQRLFQWVNSLHQVAKVLELKLLLNIQLNITINI